MPDIGSVSTVDFVAAVSGVVKTSGGIFYEIDCTNNTGASSLYLQIFDNPIVPADGAAPTFCVPLQVAVGEKISYAPSTARLFVSGLSWCASSTAATKTVAGGTPFGVSVQYR